MTSSELITPPRASSPPESTFGEMVDETLPLLGAVPVYGPPIIAVAGPWLLLVLMLAGPFTVLVTLVVAMLAAATVVAALVAAVLAILAAPRVLVRHLRRPRESHASAGARAPQAVAIDPRRVVA